jgi:hypothetical protein
LSGHICEEPFGLILAEYADVVATLEAKLHHTQTEMANMSAVIIPRDLLPYAVRLFPKSYPIAKLFHLL